MTDCLKYFKRVMMTLLISCVGLQAKAQSDSSQLADEWIGFPLLFSNPESGFGLGAGGLYAFSWSKDSATRRSSMQLGGAYTSKKQVLSYFSWQIFSPQNRYYTFGELGYYDFSYLFYGLGNSTSLANEEVFYFDLVRSRISALRRVSSHGYIGLRWNFDYWNITATESDGFINSNNLIGIDGGRTSATGLVFLYDSRDNVFYPRQGWYVDFSGLAQGGITGSSFANLRFKMDAARYWSVYKKGILAINFQWEALLGRTAFFDLPQLGGLKNLRGYYLGRFRGKHLQLLQAEYRQNIIGRWGAVVFGGVGMVASQLEQIYLQPGNFAGGLGLRFQVLKDSKINLRADIAWGDGPAQYYLGITEAF